MDRGAFCILTIFTNICVLEIMAATEINPLKIIDGDRTRPNQYPYIVAILTNDGTLCGGTLISHRYILTAAHCIVGTPDAKIILGAHELFENSPTEIIVTAEELIPHEDFNDKKTDGGNDIGIIKLSKPVEFSNVVNIPALPTRENINKDYTESEGTTMGWGDIENDGYNISVSDPTGTLRQMKVAIAPLDECLNMKGFSDVSDMDICAFGIHKQNVCEGDSGSPLILDNVLIGIVSRGTFDCNVTAPAIYVNVGKYLDWIEENSDVTINCK